MFHPIKGIISGLALTVFASASLAAQCGANGALSYLGSTAAGGGRTVWLSSTSAGNFRLDAA